ncbi:hypothetical protein KI387_021668, partial [Taxus chinensis]
ISSISLYFESPCFLRHPLSAKFSEASAERPRLYSGKALRLKSSRMTNQCVEVSNSRIDEFVEVGNKIADAAGHLIRQYFRKHVDILDKEDSSPVTIADRAAEEAMRSVIS